MVLTRNAVLLTSILLYQITNLLDALSNLQGKLLAGRWKLTFFYSGIRALEKCRNKSVSVAKDHFEMWQTRI